ncbi:MAG: RNA 3'-terminal phosphate cyclase (ATP) [Planctomycetota bacterium]
MEVTSEHWREQIMGIGARSKRAESVAKEACVNLEAYLQNGAPVGIHLAVHSLVPMAMAKGGVFRCGTPSLHTTTNAEVIAKFLDVDFDLTEEQEGQ